MYIKLEICKKKHLEIYSFSILQNDIQKEAICNFLSYKDTVLIQNYRIRQVDLKVKSFISSQLLRLLGLKTGLTPSDL